MFVRSIQLSFRSRLAIGAAYGARFASRILRRGQGAIIGGIVALKISPHIIAQLSHSKRTALITGTNGKSTTTRMLATILATVGNVATQSDGANMDAGIATTLIMHRRAPFAALEVDELHVPHIGKATQPQVCILLNLSRDQLDRYGELRTLEAKLRAFFYGQSMTIVANCDDVLVTSTVYDCPDVVWVAGGNNWHYDATSCPRTGDPIIRQGQHWFSSGDSQFLRPSPQWWFDHDKIYSRDGFSAPLRLSLPGGINRSNATMAIAASVAMGVSPLVAVRAIENLHEISGRYREYVIEAHTLRMILAKNPAGWHESLAMMVERPPQGIIMSINGEVQDGQDTSWLWDIDFEVLAKDKIPHIICSGKRASDLAVRLDYAELSYTVTSDPLSIIDIFPAGRIEILANYTAFMSITQMLNRVCA